MYLSPFTRDHKLLYSWLKSHFMERCGLFFIISTSIKQVKGLELIHVPFGSCCCEPTLCSQKSSPRRWNRPLLGFKNKTNISEIAGTLGVTKSTVWYILRKKERTQQHKKAWTSTEDNSGGWSENPVRGEEKPFYNIQPRDKHSPGGRRVTFKVYNQEKTSPEQIQRFTTRYKQGQIRIWQKKHLKNQTTSGKAFIGRLKIRSTCTRMTGRKKNGEGFEQLMIQIMWTMNIICETWWSSVMAWACMASSGTGLLVFIDDVTEDRSSQKNSEVYRDILSAQIQSNGAKLIGQHFIVKNIRWPKTYSKNNLGVFEGKEVEYSAMAKSISWSQPDWSCISLAEDKTKSRKTHKQTKTKVSCSKGLLKHHRGGNPVFSDVHEFQT